MVRPCCICGIKKNSEAAAKGIRFFRFPSIKRESHKKWVQTIRRHSKKTSFVPNKNSIICTHHFENDCFNRNNRRLCLKEGSRPTIFNVDDSTKQVISVACDMPQEPQEEDSNTEPPTFSLTMEDDTSESLSPPILLPLKDLNSDFEETIEDPPDLDMYCTNNEYDDNGVTSFADLDMIKMDHIGSVADILGPDSYLPEESVTLDEQPESSGEDRVEVDGQTILSFASAEEMQDYIARREARGKLTKTTDFRQIKGWQNKFHHLNQLTPSLSPSPCPSPNLILPQSAADAPGPSESHTGPAASANEPVPYTEAESENVEMDSVLDPDEARTISQEVELASEKPLGAPLELGIDGFISAEYAEWATSAVECNSKKKTASVAQEKNEPREIQETPSHPKRSILQNRLITGKMHAEINSITLEESDEVPSTDMTLFDDSTDDVVVQEEDYKEVYDVPGKLELPTVECGQLFCRLGCICDSLKTVSIQKKVSLDHCSLPECMLQCVCGYLPGKPSSRKCFAKLLKGNESFYSKINWSGTRRRRERRVPERYSEFHLGSDPITPSPPRRPSPDEDNRGRSSGPRGGNSHRSRSSSPFKYGSSSSLPAAPRRRTAADSNEIPSSNKNWKPFRVKVCADEIKLLRWNSFVSLAKVYVAPDQDIFCMEHSVYNCSCIEQNRRIIRIASKYVPSSTSPEQDKKKQSSSRVAAKSSVRSTSSSPPMKNVAKKHTNTNMRLAGNRSISPKTADTIPPPLPPQPTTTPQEPATKTSSVSKMRRLLQDEQFQLQKLMTEEKTRAFDEEVDLAVRQGQTVQLVAWIRFHRIYHAGRIHIRFLSRRSGPVILVMRPSEIVAADITCDIQSMRGDTDAPEIVKELLDPCISPEETSRYAFLLCDGVKWELVGLLTSETPEAPTPPKAKSPTLPTKTRPAPPKISDEVSISMRIVPEQPDAQQQRVANEMRLLAKCNVPARPDIDSSEERSIALEQRRLQLEERLNEIKSKLGSSSAKPTNMLKLPKLKIRPSSSQRSADRPLISGDLLPFSRPSSQGPVGAGRRKRDPDMTSYLIPDQCILPDDMPSSDADGSNKHNLPDLLIDQVIKEPSRSMYPAAEKLAMISRLIQDSGDVSIGGVKIPGVKDPAIFNSTLSRSPQSSSPAPLPPKLTPAPTSKPPEVKLLKLQPLGSALPNGIVPANQIQRIRILTASPTTIQKGKIIQPGTSTLNARNGSKPCVIKQQRIHWSNQGVKPPVASKSSPHSSTFDSMNSMAVPTSSAILPVSSSVPTGILPVNGNNKAQIVRLPQPAVKTSASSTSNTAVSTGSPDSIFPKIFTAEVSSVKSLGGSTTKSMKLIMGGMVDDQGESSTNRASMLLPLNNCDDQWCLVSIDHVPDVGLKVPGLTVFIPAKVLERAASTAMERKARVSFPLHIQGKNMGSVFRKGFGVYGTPQLPRHVFLGPFPSVYLPQCLPFQSCLITIPLTKPVPNGTSLPDESSVKVDNTKESEPSSSTPTECQPSAESPDEISCVEQGPKQVVEKQATGDISLAENNDKKDESVIVNSSDDDEVSVGATPNDSVKTISPVPDREQSVGTQSESSGSKSESDEKVMDEAESDDVEIVHESTGCLSKTPGQPAVPYYQQELNDLNSLKSQKPRKVFVARTEGLPATTMAVYDSLVRVKHPLLPQEMLTFSSIDNAKRWLQSLTTTSNSPNGSDKSKDNTSAEGSIDNSDNNEDDMIDVCGQSQEESLGQEEAVDSASSVARSPKRIRRLTEKARILAANKSKQIRTTSSRVTKRSSYHVQTSSLSKRSSTQHLMHIRKEQERRGLLCRLLRDLDSLLVPDSGSRAKIAVLNNATSTIKSLQSKAKEMEDTYRALKSRRTALLTEREKIYAGLPAEVQQIFNCLMDSLALPIRHLTVSETISKRTRNAKLNNHQDPGSIEVVITNNT